MADINYKNQNTSVLEIRGLGGFYNVLDSITVQISLRLSKYIYYNQHNYFECIFFKINFKSINDVHAQTRDIFYRK